MVKSRGLAHLAALGLVSVMLHCVFVKNVEFVDLEEVHKTGCFGETTHILHVPSSSRAGKRLSSSVSLSL